MKPKILYKPIPRRPELQALVGSYPVVGNPEIIESSEEFKYLRWYFDPYDGLPYPHDIDLILNNEWTFESKGKSIKTKLSKILPRINPRFSYSNLVKPGRNDRVWISVRYHDILRCSITRDFKSCFNPSGCNSHVPNQMLEDDSVAIMFVRDKAGKFSSRCFLYLIKSDTNELALGIGRPYGNLGLKQYAQAVFLALKKANLHLPVISIWLIDKYDFSGTTINKVDYYSDVIVENRIRGDVIMPT